MANPVYTIVYHKARSYLAFSTPEGVLLVAGGFLTWQLFNPLIGLAACILLIIVLRELCKRSYYRKDHLTLLLRRYAKDKTLRLCDRDLNWRPFPLQKDKDHGSKKSASR